MYKDATVEEIDSVMKNAWKVFHEYRKLSLKERAGFMKAIAIELEACGDVLIQTAMRETNLPEARLRSERTRTMFQLTSYAEYCEQGTWLDVRIDTSDPNGKTHKKNIRKTSVPLGPVVIFGSSNFPFAYSTAGGDTATALAAGCPVIVKAHPAHAETSEMVANAILCAAEKCNMPDGVFAHVHGASFEVGKALVMHPHTKAVGFTGSYPGGKQLFDWGNERKEPIPVFSEMGSVNPVFLLPEKLKQSATDIAKMYAESITQGVGQFCTKPGLIIGLESDALQIFINALGDEIKPIAAATMLHPGIFKSYVEKRANALIQEHVDTVSVSDTEPLLNQGAPTIASTSGEAFLNNSILQQEVFGPYSIVVRCKDMTQMIEVVKYLEGQLTATLMATETDISYHEELVEAIRNICGRFILNDVPTGVQVGLSMQHGGPFPATTDSRFTSVGGDGIKRFVRPIAFQNWPDRFLPEELQDENPLNIWRTINNQLTKEKI